MNGLYDRVVINNVEFSALLDELRYEYLVYGELLLVTHDGDLIFEDRFNELSGDVIFANSGCVTFGIGVGKILGDVVFANGGNVVFEGLQQLNNAVFLNIGCVSFDVSIDLHNGVLFRNNGNVCFYWLHSINPDLVFENVGDVCLELSENCSLPCVGKVVGGDYGFAVIQSNDVTLTDDGCIVSKSKVFPDGVVSDAIDGFVCEHKGLYGVGQTIDDAKAGVIGS